MWEILIQILPMILPLIIDLFDKGPAACKLWAGYFSAFATGLRVFGTAMLELAPQSEYTLKMKATAGGAEALAAAVDIIAGTLKCCAAKPELCEQMAKAAKEGPEVFAGIAMAMSQKQAV